MGSFKRRKPKDPVNEAEFKSAYGLSKTPTGTYLASIHDNRCRGILDCYGLTAEDAKQKLIKRLRDYANWLTKQ